MLSPENPVGNRQVQKTQTLLRNALADLIHKKDYDSITVKEILDRANVGRSTFYAHFRDKDELLVSGIHDMFRTIHSVKVSSSAEKYERIIRFSLPVFEYHFQHRRTSEEKMGPKGRAILHKHLENLLIKFIADDIEEDILGRLKTEGQISLELLIRYVASTFHLVLNWWVESRNPLPPKVVNDLFRALVLPTLSAAWK